MNPCEIRIEAGSPRRGEPVTLGVPLPRGAVTDVAHLALADASGAAMPLQARALDLWPGGSVRWALLDWQATLDGATSCTLSAPDAASHQHQHPHPIRASASGGGVTIDTGALHIRVRPGGRSPFDEATLHGAPALDVARCALTVEDAKGNASQVTIREVLLEEDGPLRASLLVRADVGHDGREPLLRVAARLHVFAGSPSVRFSLSLHNPRRAVHPGGFWELGDPGSVLVRDAALTLALPPGDGATAARWSLEADAPFEAAALPLEVYQDSSGGEAWRSSNHANREGKVPHTFRGYRRRAGAGTAESEGLRATPAVSIARGERRISFTAPYFWQCFPKAVEATADTLTVRILPRRFADLHELQGGERTTFLGTISLGEDAVTPAAPLAWARAPATARTEPAWVAASGAIPFLVPKSASASPAYEGLVDAAIEGLESFPAKRERIDEYGWRHFGDIYGDHEAVFTKGEAPLVSHYNNQYDPILGMGLQLLRSGDARWRAQMDALAQHVTDIDIYRTDRDKAAYNGGLFWHTVHYVDAGRAHHRTYPRAPKSHGGGPHSEMNYPSGLALRYLLTGDRDARDAALGLARWVIDMDDGRRTVFRVLDGGPTGLATASGTFSYHGPGRGGGNSLNALVDGHRLTGDAAFLAKADEVIRRCVHPEDDIESLSLLDAERRWYYTMFLQALGKYLHAKAERGEADAMYAYGRACLLHYARWMARREYPYLEKPEILEYPTETWAAQDMRKAEVFSWAALFAEGEERALFVAQAKRFFAYSTETLRGMATRALCRPVVLLLTNGVLAGAVAAGQVAWPAVPPSPAQGPWPPKVRFVPQKERAMRRAKLLLAALAGLFVVGIGAVAALWLRG